MRRKPRIVLDANVLVSRLLMPDSQPARAVRLAVEMGDILLSQAVIDELSEVLGRAKFDRYVSRAVRTDFVRKLLAIAEVVEIAERVQACRDPKDDKYLDVAINGNADCILSGDRDLQALHPFLGIAILSPVEFIEMQDKLPSK